MEELKSHQVRIEDKFWTPRLSVNAGKSIFHQWQQLEATRCIDNFRIAAGEKEGFREGWFFADSDAYKWLDAASRIVAVQPDPELIALMDDFISLLGREPGLEGARAERNRERSLPRQAQGGALPRHDDFGRQDDGAQLLWLSEGRAVSRGGHGASARGPSP